MNLQLRPLRFTFLARQPVHFPPGKAANVIRGALGHTLRSSSCTPECPGAATCPFRSDCAYARLFEPTTPGQGPSGLTDWPRPFVLRAAHLDGLTVPPGTNFSLDINLFDLHPHAPLHLIRALSQLADTGLGPGRGSVLLTSVAVLSADSHPSQTLYQANQFLPLTEMETLTLSLLPPVEPFTSLQIKFASPTELKGVPHHPTTIPFAPLFARVRDRLSNLRRLYGDGPLDIDYRQLGDLATSVTCTSTVLHHASVDRFSSRRQTTHSLSGFLGHATYQGNMTPFIPYLQAAFWSGVGKHTVWGNGKIELFVNNT
ncbi:MAG: CRISPR system precrRNA processing endoribonuclease RAMP protein Cas6 [Acidobacteria bacterium]|nr:CRISPR system precrRNA processing endoribonuclease RAMP protein Cas6 [Acidobacteriota bacterium]